MKKFAATNVCRPSPSRVVPNTRVAGAGSGTSGMWHDWQLCVVLEVAVEPFLIRHLLRQAADDLPVGSERLREQRVAGRAQLGVADVRRPASAGSLRSSSA